MPIADSNTGMVIIRKVGTLVKRTYLNFNATVQVLIRQSQASFVS